MHKPLQIEAWMAYLTFHDQENIAEFFSQQHAELRESLRCMAVHYGYGRAKRAEGFDFVAHFIRIFEEAQQTHQTHQKILKAFAAVLDPGTDQVVSGSKQFLALISAAIVGQMLMKGDSHE